MGHRCVKHVHLSESSERAWAYVCGFRQGLGVGGETSNPVFFARLMISIVDSAGKQTMLTLEAPVQGIPKIEQALSGLEVGGQSIECVGLLGRDLMQFCKFSYDGLTGQVSIRVDTKAIGSIASAPA